MSRQMKSEAEQVSFCVMLTAKFMLLIYYRDESTNESLCGGKNLVQKLLRPHYITYSTCWAFYSAAWRQKT